MTNATATPYRRQRIELDCREYEVVWLDGDRQPLVRQVTVRGTRTLHGYGRAWRPELAALVIAAALRQGSAG